MAAENHTVRDIWYRGGHFVWENSYRVRQGDDAFAQQVAAKAHRDMGLMRGPEDRAFIQSAASAKWVDGGCRIITTNAKYFAAMAHTSIPADAFTDLEVPWPAFVVEWPSGLCVGSDGYDYNTALFAQFDAPWILPNGSVCHVSSAMYITSQRIAGTPDLHRVGPISLADLLFKDDLPEEQTLLPGDVTRNDGDVQIQEMVARACAGLLFTMQHTRNWKTSPFSSPVARGRLRSSPPPHRTIYVGRPIALDATDAVRSRASGKTSKGPSVQTLVRGHLKRQAFGASRSARKIVWIEPYWRGPEDAPILTRPYRVGRSTTHGDARER